MEKAMCFAGHRSRNLNTYAHLSGILKAIIIAAYKKGVTKFISGGAIGIDQLAAGVGIELRDNGFPIELIIAKPFDGQESKWPGHVKGRYRDICSKANHVVVVSPGEYESWKFHKRNKWMVDRSHYVCAVWDGREKGGTYSCIQYAIEKRRQILYVKPDYSKYMIWHSYIYGTLPSS